MSSYLQVVCGFLSLADLALDFALRRYHPEGGVLEVGSDKIVGCKLGSSFKLDKR